MLLLPCLPFREQWASLESTLDPKGTSNAIVSASQRTVHQPYTAHWIPNAHITLLFPCLPFGEQWTSQASAMGLQSSFSHCLYP